MDIYLKLRIGLNFFELIACVMGFIYWKKIRNSYWKFFPVYLAVIVITELTAEYTGYVAGNWKLTADLYYFFGIPIQFVFFYWLFYKWFEHHKERNWALTGAVIYLITLLTDILFFNQMKFWFSSLSYLTGNIILLVLIIIFFLKFINSSQILNYRASMMFWTCTGLLIFYLGSLPFYGLWNTLVKKHYDVFNTYWIVQICFNYCMYLFFAFAFIWGKPK
jgi:hypothetical protein